MTNVLERSSSMGSARKSIHRSHWPLLPILAASGFAGLGYEIVWTRMLSLALGTEMTAVLGVIAGFFGGLALGAFVLDGAIRRAASPRLAYALLEAAIGGWGLFSIFLLPAAGRALPRLLGIDTAPTLLWLADFLFPTLALLPATVAMGGTLAALDRMMVSAGTSDRMTAGVYGSNTAGAVLGVLAVTFLLLPHFGLSGSLIVLALVNLVCAGTALAFGPADTRSVANVTPPTTEIRKNSGLGRLIITLFATGFIGVAFEVIIIRLAAQVLQDTLYTFAGLLAAYLAGTALGGLLWQLVDRPRRAAPPAWLFAATALACLGTASLIPHISEIAHLGGVSIAAEFGVALFLFFIPSALMGALFSELAQSIRDHRASLGWAVGVNSVGAAFAPIFTTVLLIPGLGAWPALLLVCLGYLLLVPFRASSLAWGALAAAYGAYLLAGPMVSLVRVPLGGTLLATREGPMVTASVVDDQSGARYLEVNGHFRMGGTGSVRSDYRQAILPLLLHPSPKKALFLGIGTGATLIGGAQMPGVSVRGVEISPEIVELLPQFLDSASTTIPVVAIADARRFILADTKTYDVIVADLYHPALDGSGALYTKEHFAAIRDRLSPSGIFCQWLPLYQLDAPSLRTIIRSFLDIYPDGSAWLNHYSVRTPMLALIGTRSPFHLDLQTLSARLHDRDMEKLVKPLGFEEPIDLLGQYVGASRTLAQFAGDGPRNTDDFPAIALDASRNVRSLTAPPASLLLTVMQAMKPEPQALLGTSSHQISDQRLMDFWRARDRFLEAGAALHGDPRGHALLEQAAPGLLEVIRISPEFNPAYRPLIAMAAMEGRIDQVSAARLLQEIVEAAPSRSEAKSLLATISAH